MIDRVDGYAMLYKDEKTPAFCSYCGRELDKRTLCAGFDIYTGDEIRQSWYLCPLKSENSKHSAWLDVQMTPEEYNAQYQF